MSKDVEHEVMEAVTALRETNEKALAQKADKGYVDAQLEEALAKQNAAVDAALAKHESIHSRLDDIERAVQLGAGAQADGDSMDVAAEFSSFLHVEAGGRGSRPAISIEDVEGYEAAYDKYLRLGAAGLGPEMLATLSVGSNPAGGYWVLPDRSGRMVTRVFESSPMRAICDVTMIGTDALEGVRDDDEAGCGWVGETQDRTETTTPDVGTYRIPVHEVYAEPRITQKLLDDSAFDVEGWLEAKGADKFARTENTAFVSGNGVLKPRGLLSRTIVTTDDDTRTWGQLQYVPTGAAGAFASSNPGDALIELVFKVKETYLANARFLMRRSTEAATRKLKDGQGNYLWQPDFTVRTGRAINGYPVTNGEDMPVIAADSYSVAFGDFRRGYQIVDRMGIRVLRDPYTKKGWVKLYMTKRVGGDLIDSEAIKVLKFASS